MKTFKRICKKNFTVEDEKGNSFTIKKGDEYITSAKDAACAAHGPDPKKDYIVVFDIHWILAPLEIFEPI